MSIILIGLIPGTLFFSGCGKFGAGDNCDSDMGDITIYNFSSYNYKFYIESTFNTTIHAWDTLFLVLESRTYDFKLIRESSYDSVPKTIEEKFSILPCTSHAWDPK